VREVNVQSNEVGPIRPMAQYSRAMAASVSSDAALAVEPGRGNVTITVNGTVQMK